MAYSFPPNASCPPYLANSSGSFNRPPTASQYANAQWTMGATGLQQSYTAAANATSLYQMANPNLPAFRGQTPFSGNVWNGMGAWGGGGASFSEGIPSGSTLTAQNWTGNSWNAPESVTDNFNTKSDKSRDTRFSDYDDSYQMRERDGRRGRRRSAERSKRSKRDDPEKDNRPTRERDRYFREDSRLSRDREGSEVRHSSPRERNRRSFSRDRTSRRRPSPDRWQLGQNSRERESQKSVCYDWSTSNTDKERMQSSINQPMMNSTSRQMKHSSHWPVHNQSNQSFTSLANTQSLTSPVMKNPSIDPWVGENKTNLPFANLAPAHSAAMMMTNSQAMQFQGRSQMLQLQEHSQALQLQEQSRIMQLEERSRVLQLQEQEHERAVHLMKRSQAMHMQQKSQAMVAPHQQSRGRVRVRGKRPFSAPQTANPPFNKNQQNQPWQMRNKAGNILGKRPSTMFSKGFVVAKKLREVALERAKTRQQPTQQKKVRTVATWCAIEDGKPNLYFSGKRWPRKQVVGQRNCPLLPIFQNSALPDLPPDWKTKSAFFKKAPGVELPRTFASFFCEPRFSKEKPKTETATDLANLSQLPSDSAPVSKSPISQTSETNSTSETSQASASAIPSASMSIPKTQEKLTQKTSKPQPLPTLATQVSKSKLSPISLSQNDSDKPAEVTIIASSASSSPAVTQQGKLNYKENSNKTQPAPSAQSKLTCSNPEITPTSLSQASELVALHVNSPSPASSQQQQELANKRSPRKTQMQPEPTLLKTRSAKEKPLPIEQKSQPKKGAEPTNNSNHGQENDDSTSQKAITLPPPQVNKKPSPKILPTKPDNTSTPDLPSSSSSQPNTRSVRTRSQLSTENTVANTVGSSAPEDPNSASITASDIQSANSKSKSNCLQKHPPLSDRDSAAVSSSAPPARPKSLLCREIPRVSRPRKTRLSQPHPKSVLGRLLSHSAYFQSRSVYNQYRLARSQLADSKPEPSTLSESLNIPVSMDLKPEPSALPELLNVPVSTPSKLATTDTCGPASAMDLPSQTLPSLSQSETRPVRRKAQASRR